MPSEIVSANGARPVWWVALQLIRARPGYFTICVFFATLVFCLPLAAGLVTRAFFDVLTGSAPAGFDVPTVISLFIAVAITEMMTGIGLDFGWSSVKHASTSLML